MSVTNENTDVASEGMGPVSPKSASKALKVLFLSSDTGGGHRASAESLAER